MEIVLSHRENESQLLDNFLPDPVETEISLKEDIITIDQNRIMFWVKLIALEEHVRSIRIVRCA
jgi:hypothetical protein